MPQFKTTIQERKKTTKQVDEVRKSLKKGRIIYLKEAMIARKDHSM